MDQFKLLIKTPNPTEQFKIDNSLLIAHYENVFYFCQFETLTSLFDSFESDNNIFNELIQTFKQLYTVYYEGNKEISLALGQPTGYYVALTNLQET